MRKLIASLALGYVLLALYYRARETAGLMTCDCYPGCWCKEPGLSIFRWVAQAGDERDLPDFGRQLGEAT